MIKINLQDNYITHEIKSIFQNIAKKIVREINPEFIKILTPESTNLDITDENIYRFLISSDYFKYKFSISSHTGNSMQDEEIRSFLNLPTTKWVKSKRNSNLICRQFNEKYYNNYNYLLDAFNYDKLSSENRDIIISNMNISVCPYCNMNYIINFDKNGKKSASADLDHFYPKSLYPFYSLCLYNFVPSCQICNSRLKGSIDMQVDTHVHPHFNNFGKDGYFKISNIIEAGSKTHTSDVIISLESKNSKVSKSNDVFKIEERYKELKNKAADYLNSARVYNECYIDELNGLLNSSDVKTLIFGKELSEEDLLNESLGKFKMDLLKQLDIFR
ncbi:MAG: hypothetical protein R3Y09_11195 [Clostridia bacterium]